MIGITGATGQLGRLVVEKLKAVVPAGGIVALVRNPAKAADLGVPVREADYNQPSTLDAALQGIDVLLLISGNEVGQRTNQHRNVIEAAKKAGVKRIVYTSVLRAETTTLLVAPEHLETEKLLLGSGVAYTLLRNGWYTENYTASVPGAVKGGAFLGSAGDAKISTATRADYAEAAVAVLTQDGHANKIYELAGDDFYTLTDLAAEISRQTGKAIPYKNLSEAEYAATLSAFLPEMWAKAYANFDTSAARGDLFDDGRQLSKLIGHPTTPLKEAVAAALR